MKYFIFTVIIFFISISGPADAFGQSISFIPSREGDSLIRIDAVISSSENINTIGGVISSNQAIQSIVTGNSIIPFWIQSPTVINKQVSFSGIVPGGFSGRGTLFSFLVPFGENLNIKLDSGQVFKNDGLGTEITLSGEEIVLSLDSQKKLPIADIVIDKNPPEVFIPEFITDTSVFNNHFGISFATQDKQSGIAYYQVKRYPYKFLKPIIPWKKTQETFIPLSRFYKFMHIEIRAVDRAENIRTVTMSRTQKFSFYEFIVLIIVSGILIIIIARKVYK